MTDYKYTDYYLVNKEERLQYAKDYYNRPGMKEKRKEYQKKYYERRRKYVVCEKCCVSVLEINYILHTTSFLHMKGRRPKKVEYNNVKEVEKIEKPKPPLLDKIVFYT